MSQLELAGEAGVSARHLSFVETGRSRPSRAMLLKLCECLAVPLRERNRLLLAAGLAPSFPERSLDDSALTAARRAVELILKGHEPYPALAVDRRWTLVAANGGLQVLLTGLPETLLVPPVNVLRLSLRPDGLAGRIINLAEWRNHVLERLDTQIDASGDPDLISLRDELAAYPVRTARRGTRDSGLGGVAVPLVLESDAGLLSFITTTTVFGTPLDVTLADIAIESFFPADDETAARLHALAGTTDSRPGAIIPAG